MFQVDRVEHDFFEIITNYHFAIRRDGCIVVKADNRILHFSSKTQNQNVSFWFQNFQTTTPPGTVPHANKRWILIP